MDSVGIGELPDAPSYGDQGSNTVGNIARQIALKVPALRSLGLDRLVDLGGHTGPPLQPVDLGRHTGPPLQPVMPGSPSWPIVVGADLRIGPPLQPVVGA